MPYTLLYITRHVFCALHLLCSVPLNLKYYTSYINFKLHAYCEPLKRSILSHRVLYQRILEKCAALCAAIVYVDHQPLVFSTIFSAVFVKVYVWIVKQTQSYDDSKVQSELFFTNTWCHTKTNHHFIPYSVNAEGSDYQRSVYF